MSYKFSAIKEFNFNQPELIFTNDESIVFFDGKGSVFKINEDLREELVLAIAEAAQNIVKHAYKDIEDTSDKMEITISLKDQELEDGINNKFLYS